MSVVTGCPMQRVIEWVGEESLVSTLLRLVVTIKPKIVTIIVTEAPLSYSHKTNNYL